MNRNLTEKWLSLRGISVVSIAMNPVTLPDEDAEMIKQAQRTAVMRDPTMAAATIVGAQSDAMKAAASNKAGAMTGFMGLGMAAQAGGVNAQNLFQMGAQNSGKPDSSVWKCECGTENMGRFCSNCGKPAAKKWVCSCGTENTGKFCTNCGKPMTSDWTCSCGTVNTGNFCSQCGNKKPE